MIHRVCLLCHRPTTRVTRHGDHICERCQAVVDTAVELLLLRDQLYEVMLFGEVQRGSRQMDPRALNAKWN